MLIQCIDDKRELFPLPVMIMNTIMLPHRKKSSIIERGETVAENCIFLYAFTNETK